MVEELTCGDTEEEKASNQWLWRYFFGYIKPMTMTVFVASLDVTREATS
jgi:hypothetical protein